MEAGKINAWARYTGGSIDGLITFWSGWDLRGLRVSKNTIPFFQESSTARFVYEAAFT